jgi:hypothetical protein
MTRLGVADIFGMVALALSCATLWFMGAAPSDGIVHQSLARFASGSVPGVLGGLCFTAAFFAFNYHATLTKLQRDEQLKSTRFQQVAAVLIEEVGVDAPFGFMRQQRRLMLYTSLFLFGCGSVSFMTLLLANNLYLALLVFSLLPTCVFLFGAWMFVHYVAQAQVNEMAIAKVTEDITAPRSTRSA